MKIYNMYDHSYDDKELDISDIKFLIYVVFNVPYNNDKNIMNKIVYDEIARYKAEKEGL